MFEVKFTAVPIIAELGLGAEAIRSLKLSEIISIFFHPLQLFELLASGVTASALSAQACTEIFLTTGPVL